MPQGHIPCSTPNPPHPARHRLGCAGAGAFRRQRGHTLYPRSARHRLGEAGAGALASSAAAGASAAANSFTGWKFCSTGSAAACSAANALRVAAGSVM